MSRINDALKQARLAQPRAATNAFPPQHMAAQEDRTSPLVWIIPSVIIFLIIAGIFFVSWDSAHRTVNEIVNNAAATNQHVVVEIPVPVIHTSAPPVVETEPADLPVLQGGAPAARGPAVLARAFPGQDGRQSEADAAGGEGR